RHGGGRAGARRGGGQSGGQTGGVRQRGRRQALGYGHHQVEAKPSVYFIKFDDDFHIYVYDLVKTS
ncbi:hypothetical protein KUCAC02_028000, partial [Chaenocephalus aceratus]